MTKTFTPKKEVKYGWVKSRQCWSSGKNKTWDFHEVALPFDKESRDTLMQEIDEKWEWSEHYRGSEIVRIKHPPKEMLIKEAEYCADRSKRYKETAKRYRDLAKTLA